MTTLERMEILELADGESIELHVTKWEEGKITIYPQWKPEGKEIRVLRVFVPPSEKLEGPPYWDVTAQTLIAQLLPHLQVDTFRARLFRVTKHGVAPKARFSLEVRSA